MNLYVHFPFCRSKCAYCALHSHAGAPASVRDGYVHGIARSVREFLEANPACPLSTLYFGGGTPSCCDLGPVLELFGEYWERTALPPDFEFTVEVNPADVTVDLLDTLKRGGVNRLSMGVQSFDDRTLLDMGRPHDSRRALEAWRMIRDAGFGNAGFDLICGWPKVSDGAWRRTLEIAAGLAPDHCSVYTLIVEPGTRICSAAENGMAAIPSDDEALAELAQAQAALAEAGLERYEISNFARPGRECRHNLAVWRGEDYTGIGEGAASREGNDVSRVIFRLRLLKEGFDPVRAAAEYPSLAPRVAEWCAALDRFAGESLLRKVPSPDGKSAAYLLTPRGAECCDTVLAELV